MVAETRNCCTQFLVAVDGAGPANPHPEHPGQADHGERVQHPHPGTNARKNTQAR